MGIPGVVALHIHHARSGRPVLEQLQDDAVRELEERAVEHEPGVADDLPDVGHVPALAHEQRDPEQGLVERDRPVQVRDGVPDVIERLEMWGRWIGWHGVDLGLRRDQCRASPPVMSNSAPVA